MPRKIDDVIIPVRKRTIRDIPIPQRHKRPERMTPEVQHPVEAKKSKRKFSRKRIWVLGGTLFVVFVFIALSIFDGGTISYVPKSASLTFNGDVYTARKTGEDFPYSVVKLSKELSKNVPASGSSDVSHKASGRIVVYNTGSKPQNLRATTRFETPDGKIYQIENAVVVPPGSLEVTVQAEKPGSGYNIGLTDLTLPGLKGTALFSSVYARSKTPMTGGFVGKESVVKPEDKIRAETELQESLKQELLSEAKAQVPEGFIMTESLNTITFETLPATSDGGGNSATLKVKGDFAGVMFKAADLYNELASSKTTLSQGESVDIMPIEALEITFAGTPPRDLVSLEEINISVKGSAKAVWRTDEISLKADLAGKHKRDIPSILNNYPTIVTATATVKPFWRNTFPSGPEEITIKKLSTE